MENGFKNWPIVRKMLIDNRLEHAALLAYSIGVPEQMFVRRATTAYRKIEVRIDDQVSAANDILDTIAKTAESMAKEAEAEESEPPTVTKVVDPDVVPPKAEGSEP